MPESFASAFALALAVASANTLASVVFFQGVERRRAGEARLYDLAIPPGQLKREQLGSAIFVVTFSAVWASLLSLGAIRTAGPDWSWGAATITFLGCFLCFDVYYFFFHKAMHGRLRPIHEWHHASRVNSPWTALSLSPLEGAGWLLGMSLWPVLGSSCCPSEKLLLRDPLSVRLGRNAPVAVRCRAWAFRTVPPAKMTPGWTRLARSIASPRVILGAWALVGVLAAIYFKGWFTKDMADSKPEKAAA